MGIIVKAHQFYTLVKLQQRPIWIECIRNPCAITFEQIMAHPFHERDQFRKLMQVSCDLIYQAFNFTCITLMLRVSLALEIIHQAYVSNAGERNDDGDQDQAAQQQNFPLQAQKPACRTGSTVKLNQALVEILPHRVFVRTGRSQEWRKDPSAEPVALVTWIIQRREPAGTVHAVIFRAEHQLRGNVPAQAHCDILGKAAIGRSLSRRLPFFSAAVIPVCIQDIVTSESFPSRGKAIDPLKIVALPGEILLIQKRANRNRGIIGEIVVFKVADRILRSEAPASRRYIERRRSAA